MGVVRRRGEIDEIEIEFHVDYLGRLLTFHHRHRAGEKLAVERKAHRRDMTGLLRAEKISGSAYLKIAHGEIEARAERAVALKGGEPFTRVRVYVPRRRKQKIGAPLTRRAPDTPAKLI